MMPRIGGMGGAQMYALNKLKYMKACGWDVKVIYSYNDDMHIHELKKMGEKIDELAYSPYLFADKIKASISNKISLLCRNYKQIIIESTCLQEALWGEIVARKVGAKHIIYLLQETNEIFDEQWYKYLKFKHDRRELVSINKTSLYDMFKPFHPIAIEESYELDALSSNVVQDYDCELVKSIQSDTSDFTVGFLSRLDKPFVIPCLSQFRDYVLINNKRIFKLIIIGGAFANSNVIKKINTLFAGIENVHVFMTGTLFPIPRKLIQICDVFLSSAGSAIVVDCEGIPTITFDANDHCPIGIYNITTNNVTFRGQEPLIKLEILLNQILLEKKCIKQTKNTKKEIIEFSKHLEFIDKSEIKKEYFNVDDIRPTTRVERRLKILLSVIPIRMYNRLSVVYNKFKNLL